MFKTKDTFTLLNIICGFISILMVIEGNLFLAALFIFLGFVSDALDGPVARLLKQGNKFGASYDNVADLITYSVAPSFVVYLYLKQSNLFPGTFHLVIAAIIASLPILTGSYRFARFNIHAIEFPGFWFGLPRPATGLTIMAMVLSHFRLIPYNHFLFIAIVISFCILNISKFPYIAHRSRKLPFRVKFFITLFFITTGGALIYSALALWVFNVSISSSIAWAMDSVLLWMVLYALFSSFIGITKEEWAKLRAFRDEWVKEDAKFQ